MFRFRPATLILAAVAFPAAAQEHRSTRPIDGYVCMTLNLPPGYLYEHRDQGVPEYASASPEARVIGIAPNVVPVRVAPPTNGFLAILRPDRSLAWIDARYLKPWSNPYAPTAHCHPVILSNGSIGIGP